jgi:hypothetical protein
MCKFSFPNLKYFRAIPVFVITLIVGLWVAGVFENYHLRFYIEKRFTAEQEASLVGKKVLMHRANGESQVGTIVAFSSYGYVEICCTTIERKENANIGYGKSAFDSGVTVLDD